MCNTPTERAFEVVFALLIIALSGWIWWRASKGTIGGFYLSGQWTEGKKAQGCATILAVTFTLLGNFILISAIFYLDC